MVDNPNLNYPFGQGTTTGLGKKKTTYEIKEKGEASNVNPNLQYAIKTVEGKGEFSDITGKETTIYSHGEQGDSYSISRKKTKQKKFGKDKGQFIIKRNRKFGADIEGGREDKKISEKRYSRIKSRWEKQKKKSEKVSSHEGVELPKTISEKKGL